MIKASRKFSINGVNWDGKVLTLIIKREFSNEDKIKFVIQERKSKKTIELGFNSFRKDKYTICKFFLDNLSELESGRWDFYLILNKKKFRLGFFNYPNAKKEIRYFRPINNQYINSFVPYITERNGLSIYCGNLLRLQDECYRIIESFNSVEKVDIKNGVVNIRLLEPFKFKAEMIKLYAKYKNKVVEIPVNFNHNLKLLTFKEKYILSLLDLGSSWNFYITSIKGSILFRNKLGIKYKGGDNSKLVKINTTKDDYEKTKVISDNIYIKSMNYDDDNIYVYVNKDEIEHAEKVKILLKKRKSTEILNVDYIVNNFEEKVCFTIPISQFKGQFSYVSRWDLYFEISHDNLTVKRRVGTYYNTNDLNGVHSTKYYPLENDLGVSAYITVDNELSFYFSKESQYLHSKYYSETKVQKVKIKKNGEMNLSFTIKVKDKSDFKVNYLLLRNRKEQEKYYKFPCENKIKGKEKLCYVYVKIDLKSIEFEPFYWDFLVCLDINGEEFLKRIKNNNYSIKRKLKRVFFGTCLKNNNYILYPYITQNDCLSITYRQTSEFEALKYKINELIASILYVLLFWLFKNRPIWITFEKYSETAQDNGFYFFKYCYENYYHERKVYFVIKKNSPDEKNLKPYSDRIVYFMSIKHLFLLLCSQLIVASETKGHNYVWRENRGKIIDRLNKKKYVFLQHGVLGLKRVENSFKPNTVNEAELFVVSSEFEREIVQKYFGYAREKIIVTGLARWDGIQEIETTNKKEILLMPTWRNWLEEVENEEFIKSDYFKAYNDILHSNLLKEILEKNDVILNFYVHPKFMNYISDFDSKSTYIKVHKFGDVKVNELIMRADLLITDYSSVAWEMFYQKKPVLFFHFDVDKYIEYQGSYMDLQNELFGDVTYNESTLISRIEEYIKSNFKEKEIYKNRRSRYFKYQDKANTERIFNEIILRESSITTTESLYSILKNNEILSYLWGKYRKIPLFQRLGSIFLKIIQ